MDVRIGELLRARMVFVAILGVLIAGLAPGLAGSAEAQEDPELAEIRVTPHEITLVVGDQQVFTATGYDQFGDPFPLQNPVWELWGPGQLSRVRSSIIYTAIQVGFAGLMSIPLT